MNIKNIVFIYWAISFISLSSVAQSTTSGSNTITSAVPFLTICLDARSSALGWSGAATSPDVFSQNQNPAKYSFYYPKKNVLSEWNYRFMFKQDSCHRDSNLVSYMKVIRNNLNSPDFKCIDSTSISDNLSIALSFAPWLRSITSDMYLYYLVVNKRLDAFQSIATSLRYLTYGDIIFTSDVGTFAAQQSPNEFALDLSYSRLLSQNLSGSIALRYIRSDLTSGQMINGVETQTGNSYAADFSFYYLKRIQQGVNFKTFSTGLYISNIGTKISYTDGEVEDFIPTNLKLGSSYSTEINLKTALTFILEMNKLLVPTPPANSTIYDDDIIYPGGVNSDIGPIEGMIVSFYDAPGGLKEELQEINWSGGIEYSFMQNYFARVGYFYENPFKGNRQFFSTGIGANVIFSKKILTIDTSYLIAQQNHPLNNTMQFSLSFAF